MPLMMGEITSTARGHRLRFQRRLDHPVERVWAALAEPEERAAWFFAGTLELEKGGKVELRDSGPGITGTVVEVVPPRVLELTWSSEDAPASTVRIELDAAGAGCLLTLTHDVDHTGHPENLAPGWHCLLDDLPAHLTGDPIIDEPLRWPALKEAYAAVRPTT